MISVFLTVGIYHTEQLLSNETIMYSLPVMPAVGDLIIPDSQVLKNLLEKKKQQWYLDDNQDINYVRAIAYFRSTPIIMLGAKPGLIRGDLYYNDKWYCIYFNGIPQVGQSVYINKLHNTFYFDEITLTGPGFIATLSNSKISPSVHVDNRCITVDTQNLIEVDIVRQSTPLDVRKY